MTSTPRILVFAGSIRNGALSGKLAAAAVREMERLACHVELMSLADYPMPIYDGDLQAKEGIPESTIRLARKFAECDGFLIATPEYNQSLPSLLKNSIDWLSRLRGSDQSAFRRKVYAIVSSSSGQFGGARALIELRRVLVGAFNGLVIPEQMSLSNAESAFLPSGDLSKEAHQTQLRAVCVGLFETCRTLAGR